MVEGHFDEDVTAQEHQVQRPSALLRSVLESVIIKSKS